MIAVEVVKRLLANTFGECPRLLQKVNYPHIDAASEGN
jgi:hypothetical protein